MVQESRMHTNTLKLELVNNKPHMATYATDTGRGQKAEIIKVKPCANMLNIIRLNFYRVTVLLIVIVFDIF